MPAVPTDAPLRPDGDGGSVVGIVPALTGRTDRERLPDPARDASTGRAYVNFLGDPNAGRSSYGVETYDRLAALKSEYDPTNLFRLNQNVEPESR